MARTLVIVPRMYARREFTNLCPALPEDFDARTREFWDYVGERLRALGDRVSWVYRDSLTDLGGEALRELHTADPENSALIDVLLKKGAQVSIVEDVLLLGEANEWMAMLAERPTEVVRELLEASLKDRLKHIAEQIDRSLQGDEIGVLFVDPRLEVDAPKDARVIRMYPFHPKDYLVSSLARQRGTPQPQR